jgi:L-fucose isomerase
MIKELQLYSDIEKYDFFKKSFFSQPKVGFITFSQKAEHYIEAGSGEGKEAYPVDRSVMLHSKALNALKGIGGFEVLYNKEVAWDPQSALNQAREIEARGADCMIYMVGGWVFANQAVWVFKNIHLPSCLWAHTDKRSYAFVGSIVSHGALDNFGIKHEYFFGEHTEKSLLEKIVKFIRAATAVKRLDNQIMANIGGRCMGMVNSEADPVQVRNLFGVEIYHIDQGTLINRAMKMSNVTINSKVDLIKKEFGKIGVNEEKLYQSAALYLAIKDEMLHQQIYFGALKCQPELAGSYCSGCLAVSLLNDELINMSCESDINAAITMRILTLLSGQSSFFADAEHIDFKNNILHLFNCGGSPSCLAPSKKEVNLLPPPDYMGTAGGVNTQFCCREGDVTIARLDRIAGKYVMLLFKGFSSYIKPEKFKNTVAQWPHAFIKLEFDAMRLFPQLRSEHIHMVYGNYTEELACICRLLGIEAIILS